MERGNADSPRSWLYLSIYFPTFKIYLKITDSTSDLPFSFLILSVYIGIRGSKRLVSLETDMVLSYLPDVYTQDMKVVWYTNNTPVHVCMLYLVFTHSSPIPFSLTPYQHAFNIACIFIMWLGINPCKVCPRVVICLLMSIPPFLSTSPTLLCSVLSVSFYFL